MKSGIKEPPRKIPAYFRIPESLLRRFKAEAKRGRRSYNEQLIIILEKRYRRKK